MRIPVGTRLTPAVLPPLIFPAEEPVMPEPMASGTVLASVPQTYPAGPTFDSFLFSQLQNSVQPGTANTFTQPQTILLTDTGGGADSDALRPALLTLEHDTTLATVSGVGMGIAHQVKDTAGAVVRIGKAIAEITTPTAGAVDSTMAWCVMKSGVEVEVARAKGGGAGMAPVAGSSVANNMVGGQWWVRGDLLTSGDVSFQKTDTVTNAPLRMATYEHLLSAGSVAAGFGTEQFWQSKDGSGNSAPLARQQVLVTDPTTGAVKSTFAWSINHGGSEVEVMRLSALGMASTPGTSITGNVGALAWVRGDLRHSGNSLGFYNAATVTKPTVTGSRGANAALASLLTALSSLGLLTDSTS